MTIRGISCTRGTVAGPGLAWPRLVDHQKAVWRPVENTYTYLLRSCHHEATPDNKAEVTAPLLQPVQIIYLGGVMLPHGLKT